MWRKFCGLIHQLKLKAVLCILLFFTCLYNPLFSQGSYRIYKKGDIALGSVSLLSLGAFYYLQQKVAPLYPTQINQLNPSSIPAYDRVAIHHYDITARKFSNILIYASFVARVGIFYNKKKETRERLFQIGIVGYQSIFLSQAIASGCKLTLRNRPFMYNPDVPMDMKTTKDARFSFFSAHTTTVSTICFTTAYAFKLYYPNSKYKGLMWASAITIPAVEGYLRVKAGKHYPSDVITGYLVGLGTSYLMHRLHIKK